MSTIRSGAIFTFRPSSVVPRTPMPTVIQSRHGHRLRLSKHWLRANHASTRFRPECAGYSLLSIYDFRLTIFCYRAIGLGGGAFGISSRRRGGQDAHPTAGGTPALRYQSHTGLAACV